MQTNLFVLLTFTCLLGFANSQGQFGCNVNIPNGSPVFINSTNDYYTYLPCTSLPGIIFGSGNLTGSLVLGNLTSIVQTTGVQGGSQTGIIITGSQATSITFPALTSFVGSFIRVIGNPNLVTFTMGSGTTAIPNGYAQFGTQVVIQSNPNLVNPVVPIDTLGSSINSNVAVGADTAPPTTGAVVDATGATGTVSFPFLTTAYSLTVFSNGINGNTKQLAVSLPAITSLVLGLNVVGNDYLSSLTVGTGGFSITNGAAQGLILQTNKYLTTVNLNGLTNTNGPVRVDSNGATGTPFTLTLDNIVYQQGASNVFVTIQNNPGLSAISMAKLRYPTSGITIQNNPILTSVNLPGPIITSFLTFAMNGASGTPVNAVLGIQNTTGAAGVAITGSYLSQLAFPQALYFIQLNLDSNTITGAVYANTTFVVVGQATVNAATASRITRLDLSGLAYAGALQSNGLTGSGSGAQIRFDQLQVVGGTFSLTAATGFDSISFGKLVSVGGLSWTNNAFATYDFANSATNKWTSGAITLTGTNMQTINFGNLVTATNIGITIGSSNPLTISAAQLTCFNQFTVVATGSSGLSAVNLNAVTSYNAINVATSGSNGCNVVVGSGTTTCSRGCYTCPQYTGTDVNCGTNVVATGINGACSTTANATSASTCGTASPYQFSTTTANVIAPPTQTGGGQGGTPTATSSTVTNTFSTNSNNNNNNNPTTSNPSATVRTTGSGVACAASLLVLATAVALSL